MRTFAVILLGLSSVVLAADAPKAPLFWYEITVERGTSTETFVGQSSVEPGQMSIDMATKTPIILENLRSLGAKASNTPMRWWPTREGEKLFIRPDHVLWYYLLPADPAAE
jgi:hypothetical protein